MTDYICRKSDKADITGYLRFVTRCKHRLWCIFYHSLLVVLAEAFFCPLSKDFPLESLQTSQKA